ncbi:unnamed protein product [marine sediment metagenome]|uniref:Uncharacterized protein n=1 Tax=marine sediment metagenome TaxID=412755 RepID=X1KJ09_9ZZZZ
MKPIIRYAYAKRDLKKQPRIKYDRKSKERPAWIEIKGLPKGTRFVSVGYKRRIYAYQTYLVGGLFLPIDYTKEEIMKFYDNWAKGYDKA